jgi:RNA-directed DNA polymerase
MPSRTSMTGRGTAGGRDSVRQARPARDDSGGHEALTLIEQVVRRENLVAAPTRVVHNGGAPGVDGMAVDDLMPYCRQHWARIREQLLNGTYIPQPVRRVDIPKPDGKGRRTLGIPTVLDRFIQQALLQVLSPIFDPTFSDASFGVRPGRSTHQAVRCARGHIAAGHRWVVDMDLEKFFDRVNHDVLMARGARRVKDKRVLLLIRRYLQAGMMDGGLVSPRTEGTPQGGPLSPLLSNILLDEWDRELERRGHRFVRYADDCNVYVRSQAAGERVMASLERFLTTRLRLRVNREKNCVARPWKRKFLGYSVTWDRPAHSGWQKRRRASRIWISGFAANCAASCGVSGSGHGPGTVNFAGTASTRLARGHPPSTVAGRGGMPGRVICTRPYPLPCSGNWAS